MILDVSHYRSRKFSNTEAQALTTNNQHYISKFDKFNPNPNITNSIFKFISPNNNVENVNNTESKSNRKSFAKNKFDLTITKNLSTKRTKAYSINEHNSYFPKFVELNKNTNGKDNQLPLNKNYDTFGEQSNLFYL